MEVETLGVARSLGWKGHMRCANGYREGTRSMRRCVYRKQLDLETLVATRGPNFPLGRLEGRLMCPSCGNRRVTVVFEPPTNREESDPHCGAKHLRAATTIPSRRRAVRPFSISLAAGP